jgi:peroxiredoxin
MRPTNQLYVGDEAPDFCLTMTDPAGGDRKKQDTCLHDFRGLKPVIIEFYMAAFTPV